MRYDIAGGMIMELLCPICREPLQQIGRSWRCAGNHSFDIARQGYVNLLTVQQKHSLNPGDTRQQVLARRSFLDGGFYAPIADALCDLTREHNCFGPILDVGCGEGYYSTRLAAALDAPLIGLDISKEAVRCAAGRYKDALWLCATATQLPVPEQSIGLVTSLFSITAAEAFHKVLKPEGALIQVLAQPDHLLGLKSVIYPKLLQKPKETTPEIPGFSLAESVPIRFSFTVEGEQVQNLLSMTPHVYRISKEGAARLAATERLTDTASAVLNVFAKE